MALLFRLRRTQNLTKSLPLHYRLCSTFNSTSSAAVVDGNCRSPSFSSPPNSKHNDQFEKMRKQLTASLLSFRDRYATDGRLLSEKINSRQAFLNETINHLSLRPSSYPNSPPQAQEIISDENLNSLNRLDRLIKLKDILVKEDEMSEELTNSRLNSLQEIIMDFSEIGLPPRPQPELPLRRKWIELYERRKELIEGLKRLRGMELMYNSNPTSLSQTLKVLCGKLNTFKEMLAKSRLDVQEIFDNFSEASEPPPLDEGWRNTWNELYERWNELYERLVRLREVEVEMMMPLRILSERMNTLDRLMRLKDMLVKEDELSAELTNFRLTSLQDIIKSFSEAPPPLDEGALKKWNELNESLICLSSMEVQDAVLLSMRSNS